MSTMSPEGFPSSYEPFVDPETGIIAPIWVRFLNALYKRTGAAVGGNLATAATVAQVVAADAMKAPLANPTFTTGIGVFGHAPPGAQPAAPVTLADVIAIIRGAGLSQ